MFCHYAHFTDKNKALRQQVICPKSHRWYENRIQAFLIQDPNIFLWGWVVMMMVVVRVFEWHEWVVLMIKTRASNMQNAYSTVVTSPAPRFKFYTASSLQKELYLSDFSWGSRTSWHVCRIALFSWSSVHFSPPNDHILLWHLLHARYSASISLFTPFCLYHILWCTYCFYHPLYFISRESQAGTHGAVKLFTRAWPLEFFTPPMPH